MISEEAELIQYVTQQLAAHDQKIVTAESCTGGSLAAALTSIGGSSRWFERGLVTYSNAAKQELLGVSELTLSTQGAVSEPCARAMAQGALNNAHAHLAISVTGIAGPSGGSVEKPVGMVCFGWATVLGELGATTAYFKGDRQAIQQASVSRALAIVGRLIKNKSSG